MAEGLGQLNGVIPQYSYQDALKTWSPEQWQQFGANGGTYKNLTNIGEQPGFMNKTMDFLGSDSIKGLGTVAGIGTDIFGIMNTLKAQKQAKKQWEAENARANEIMAMNREKYDTYKADKSRLNSQYA